MQKPLLNRKKLVSRLNRMIWEEHSENQFEESQVMRSYSAGIIDGLGMVINLLSKNTYEEAPNFPLSLSFYEEDEREYVSTYKSTKAEEIREKMFDLQNQTKESLFLQEVD